MERIVSNFKNGETWSRVASNGDRYKFESILIEFRGAYYQAYKFEGGDIIAHSSLENALIDYDGCMLDKECKSVDDLVSMYLNGDEFYDKDKVVEYYIND